MEGKQAVYQNAEDDVMDYFIMEWIDAKEKLPPDDERVIVRFSGNDAIDIKYLSETRPTSQRRWYPGGLDMDHATHWMPLPPHPKRP